MLPQVVCLTLLLLLLTQAISVISATCPPGEKKIYSPRERQHGCEPCPDGTFQSKPNDSSFCRQSCAKCAAEKGSMVEQNCTKTTNTKCRCRHGFTPVKASNTTCKCDKGSGLKNTAAGLECKPCEDGYFTSEANTYCQKWKDCGQIGVRVPGSRLSNVICNNDTEVPENLMTSTTPSSFLASTPRASCDTMLTAVTSTTSSTPSSPWPTSENSDSSVLIFYILSLVLLVPLSAVSCKVLVIPCLKNHWKKVSKRDAPCRSPVEECGDSSRSSLVKSNQGLP